MAEVLLAHGSTMQRALLREVLRLQHTVVDSVTNGIEVVEVYETTDPDVVIMDTQLPIRDGVEAAEELRRRETTVGLVLCTMDPLDGEAITNEVADEVVSIPFRRSGLLEAVARAGRST